MSRQKQLKIILMDKKLCQTTNLGVEIMKGGERSCILPIDEQGHEKTHQIIGWYLLKFEPEKC